MMVKICVVCPKGCRLEITPAGGSWSVTGNSCPRGKAWAVQEMTDPRRIVTAVAACDSADMPFLPVRSDVPVPLKKIPSVLNRIYALRLKTPVRAGGVLIPDCPGGAKIVASASVQS